MFWPLGREACGILAPRPGMEPAPPALERIILTTETPGKYRTKYNKLLKLKYEGAYQTFFSSLIVPEASQWGTCSSSY